MHRTHALASTTPLAAIALTGAILAGCASSTREPSGKAAWDGAPRVRGGAIVALTDGDLLPSAFYDGFLFGEDGDTSLRVADTLVVIGLPLPGEPWPAVADRVAVLELSNSVIGPPRAMVVEHDAALALVLETRGVAPEHARSMRDLPRGGTLSLIDLANPFESGVYVLDQVDVGPGMLTVALHPSGGVAALVGPGAREALFVRVSPSGLTLAERYRLAGLPHGDLARPATAAFDPSGARLAVTALGADMVSFYEFEDDGETISMRPLGAPNFVGNYPNVGAWTPDGRHFVTADLQWGDPAAPEIVGAPAGLLSVVRVADASGAHERIARINVGVSPEGLAVHPSGELLITANIRGSFIPEGDARRTDGGSLSLVSLDAATGQGTLVGEYACGVAPQGLAFDATGDHLLVTDFEDGSVQVWRVVRGREPRLEFTGIVVHVGRGAHFVDVLR